MWAERLKSEYLEINQYIRGLFTVGMAWYTFFITANITAVTFFIMNYEKMAARPFFHSALVGLFLFVNTLGVGSCLLAARFLMDAKSQIEKISISQNDNGQMYTTRFPVLFSIFAILMAVSIIGVSVIWIFLLVV